MIGVLLAGGLFINFFAQMGEAVPERRVLQEFPTKLGDWNRIGADQRFSPETESVLRADDYVTRDYALPQGRFANLYIGYYKSQKSGATYHSPQNCLPGSGWEMKEPSEVEVKTPDGKGFTANAFIIENGNRREILVYWYQGRGRAVASEYFDKAFTILDGLTRRRSDGAMVRVMTPVTDSENEALEAALELSSQTAQHLSEFVPN